MFNEKLKQIREQKGYTIQNAANCLGVKAKDLEKWETGKAELPASMLPAVVKLYGCEMDALFEEELKEDKEQMQARLEELEERLSDLEEEMAEIEEEIDEIKEKLGIEDEKLTPQQIAYLKPLFPETSSSSMAMDDFEQFTELVATEFGTEDGDEKITAFLNEHEKVKADLISVWKILDDAKSVSISLVQRKMSVGYNKAGRILDGLEKMDVITEFNGACARKIKDKKFNKMKAFLGI